MTYPNIETREDYDRYVADFRDGIEGLRCLSTGHWDCPECGEPDWDNAEGCRDPECDADPECWQEPSFSRSPCDICGRHLGGDRETMIGLTDEGERVGPFEVCVDCAYFNEYGRLDDMTMLEVERAS